MTLRVAEVERIDDHADVSRVLAGLADVRDFDQLESCLMQTALDLRVAAKIAIGLLDDDVPLEQQSLEHLADVELRDLSIASTQCDVLQVEEHGHGRGRVGVQAGSLTQELSRKHVPGTTIEAKAGQAHL